MKILKFTGYSAGVAAVAIAGSLLMPIHPSHADDVTVCPDGTYLNIDLHTGTSCVPDAVSPTQADTNTTQAAAPAVAAPDAAPAATSEASPSSSCQP